MEMSASITYYSYYAPFRVIAFAKVDELKDNSYSKKFLSNSHVFNQISAPPRLSGHCKITTL